MTNTRFAPSPTGDLHLGGALVAMASWLVARGSGGAFRLRVEDLDPPRVVAGAEARILEDLAWLGLDWDGAVVRQSARTAAYEAALASLQARGAVYPCDCSRAEIARVASAPHEGEERVYPGTCRLSNASRQMKRDPASRLKSEGIEAFEDLVVGAVSQRLEEHGDFVLRRGDGVFAYQLAVAVDDAEMGIDLVVRGRDLLGSTGRQRRIMHLIGYDSVPRTAHVPMVVDAQGERLAKRSGGARVRGLREAGVGADEVTDWLRGCLGSPSAGAPLLWPSEPIRVPQAWARFS